jgi:hypothetical protein
MRQARNANKSRRAHEFKVGEQVMLSTENMNVGERARKLCAKYAGPHRIIEHPSANTYRLELPPELSRLHPVFNASVLKPFKDDGGRFPDRPRINRPPAVVKGEKEKYELEEIRDYRVSRGVGQYLVKWLGYADSESSWRPIAEVRAPELVERYLRNNPQVRAQIRASKTIKGKTVLVSPSQTKHIRASTASAPPKPPTPVTTQPPTTGVRRSARLAMTKQ